jgi:hypothetical protein
VAELKLRKVTLKLSPSSDDSNPDSIFNYAKNFKKPTAYAEGDYKGQSNCGVDIVMKKDKS